MWNVTGYDWNAPPAAVIERKVAKQIRGGDVILLHDGGHKQMGADRAQTVIATDHLIARYKAEGDQWDVKRVEQLLINAQGMQRSLELELEKTQITAPFDGIVARRYVRAGQTVARDERLFWVTATSPLRVRFTLPSRFVRQVSAGQRVAVTVADGNPAVEHEARIIQVSPVVDPGSGTIEVLAELTRVAPDLRPGMQADVHLAMHP